MQCWSTDRQAVLLQQLMHPHACNILNFHLHQLGFGGHLFERLHSGDSMLISVLCLFSNRNRFSLTRCSSDIVSVITADGRVIVVKQSSFCKLIVWNAVKKLYYDCITI